MKMMMIGKLLRHGRRHLHTIITREIIKPSSPTPSHLQTYNLSLLDQNVPNVYIPFVFFYPNYKKSTSTIHEKASELKKSLSQSLTQYYPLAGRFPTPSTPYVDCNDKGVVFLEACCDSKLDKFLDKEQDETLDQLFPDGLVWANSSRKGINQAAKVSIPLAIQLSYFSCGGVAVAVSMNHKIGDGCTLANFMNHWATVARCGSVDHKQVLPIKPHLIPFQVNNTIVPEAQFRVDEKDCVTRKFVFPNSKLRELKYMVLSMDRGNATAINNPTRSEVLTSLLYKRVVEATTADLECFDSHCLLVAMNMRNKMIEKLPETTVGNIVAVLMIQTRNTSELKLNAVVAELQKGKMQHGGIRNVQEAGEIFAAGSSTRGSRKAQAISFDNTYFCSTFCRFPFYKVDFGWGKPIQATMRVGFTRNSFVLMDTPDGEGIEAQVTLRNEDMLVLENDKQLLEFC